MNYDIKNKNDLLDLYLNVLKIIKFKLYIS